MGNKQTAIIAVLLVLGIGFVLFRQQKLESAWQAERAGWENRIAEQQLQRTQALVAGKAASDEAARLQEQLSHATNELVTAKLQVEAYEAKRHLEAQAQAVEAKKTSDRELLKAEVAAPQIVTAVIGGREQKTYTFPKLVSPTGKVLADDAEFRTQFGRRFVFKAPSGRAVAYDVDELHPGVLLHLGLNREAALTAQSDIDRQMQVAEQKYRAQLAARAEVEKKNAEIRAKLAVEYAKVAEERRKEQVEEQLRLQAAETERLKAAASMRAADAAVQEALRPFYPEYFIQQVLVAPPVVVVPEPGVPNNPYVRDPRIN